MKKTMIFSAVLLLMTSCGVYNKYERPDNVETAGLIRDALSDRDTLAVQDTASFGKLALCKGCSFSDLCNDLFEFDSLLF